MFRVDLGVCARVVFPLVILVGTLGSSSGQETLINFRLETANSAGDPISEIGVGESFMLKGYVDDLREDGEGVFASIVDVSFDASKVSIDPATVIEYGPQFENAQTGTISAGKLDDIGAIGGITPPGGDEALVFQLPVEAIGLGTVEFAATDGGSPPLTDFLLYGLNDPVVAVSLNSATINVVPEPATFGSMAIALVGLMLRRRRA